MHILIVHQAFASLDEPGGTRHYEMACLLAERGHKVTVIASSVSYITGHKTPLPLGEGSSGEGAGVKVLRARVYAAHHKSFFHRTLAFFSFMLSAFWLGLWVKDVDLVWGTSPPIFQGVTAWSLARLKRAKFLFEVRDLWPLFAIAVGVLRNPILIHLSRWLERFLYRHADRVMVNSPGFVAHVTGVQSGQVKRVELVPNGSDPSMFDPSERGLDFRRSNHLEGKFVVMYAGAHGMSNDLGVVLEAAGMLKKPEIQMVLVGDGKEKPSLLAQAKEMRLSNITFLPPVSKSEVAATLAGADACLAILKPLEAYKTTYPNKVFDYMAAGRPVVLAIDGVIREVVEAAGCGVFVPPGDPAALAQVIQAMVSDKEKARRMGLAGRRYLEKNFSRDEIGEKLISILEEMSGGG